MSDVLPFNPSVLHWARTRSGHRVEDAARRINTSTERLVEWEDPEGKKRPTVKQARKLAEIYGRPFLEFFSKDIPEVPEVTLAPDFRFHRIPPSDTETKSLEQLHRWAEEQRLNALDLLDLLGDDPPRLPEELYATIDDDVEEVAHRVRDVAEFTIDDQILLKAAERRILPDMLRTVFTRLGVLVLRHNGLHKVRTRGICLYAEPLPIMIYGKEAPGAQAFTLAHEFAHVLIQKSAMSGPVRFGQAVTEGKRVEGWCNRFAAAFLIPKETVSDYFKKPRSPLDSLDDIFLSDLAEKFAVSRHAMLIRLVTLGYVERAFYWRVKRPQFINEEENYEAPPARPRYYGSRYQNSLGSFYTGLVLEAWQTGLISGHNAAEFMGIKNLRHLDDIRRNTQ